MGLLLVLVGGVFVDYLWSSYRRAAKMDAWVEVPCRIESINIEDGGLNQRGLPKYTLDLTYRFQWEGQEQVGTRFKRLSTEASDPRKLKALLARYPSGSAAVCHVDPAAPELAVLKKDSKAGLYSIWFPCLFIVGGVGIIWTALFPKSARL